MPHTKKHAKRLLSELSLPEEASKVLEHPKYWDRGFLNLYLERCEDLIFHDPHQGLALARIAPDLAFLVSEGTTPDERLRHRELMVLAYAILGGAYRAIGRPAKANEPYQVALRLGDAISPRVRVDLHQRLAILRTCQRRYEEAIELTDHAVRFFRSQRMYLELSGSLAAQAFAYTQAGRFSQALLVASEALCYSDPKINPRIHYSATHNFAYAAVHSTDLDTINTAHKKILEARRLIQHHRRSIPKFKLCWVEGILMQKLFLRGHAERLFKKARAGFLDLETPYDIALASLDLSGLLYLEGRWSELQEIATEAYERFMALEEDDEALAALKLWYQAVEAEALHRESLAEVRETLLARMVKHRAAPAG